MAMLTTIAPSAARNNTDAAAIMVGELIKWHDIVVHSFIQEALSARDHHAEDRPPIQ
jgi:hypothetical protein